MKKVFVIYRDDILSIVTNWAAAAIILALMILPSLYAWFNIKASWDPYGNTKGIPIAVSNDDLGATLKGQQINIGKEVIQSLKQNSSLGWKFVDTTTAKKGVEHGVYFASISIPKDFSAKIATILSDNPQKPELGYMVNEKINAIAPKITAKGASGIKDEITKNFIRAANGVIFTIFNQLGIELQKNLPDIEKLKTMIFWLNDHLSEAEKIINTAAEDADTAQRIVAELQKNVLAVEGIINNSRLLSEQLTSFLDSNKDAFSNLVPTVKQNLLYMQQNAAAIEQISTVVLSTNASAEEKKTAVANGISTLNTLTKMDMLLITLFEKLNGMGDPKTFDYPIELLNRQKDLSEKQLNNLKEIQTQMAQGLQPSQQLIVITNILSKEASSLLQQVMNQYDSQIVPKMQQINEIAKTIPMKAKVFFIKADKTLPQINKILNDTSAGISFGKRDLSLIKRDFPTVKQKISSLANQIRDFEKTEDIREIIDLLRNDVKKESDFFAEPVLLKEKRLYPIPNYGSAMSPFFTTLSLWVGAMLLISLIPVEMSNLPKNYHPNHLYLGRFLTFLTIGLCQSIIVTVGDIYLLHTYVVAKLWFILFGLLISFLFMLITYTFVSIFGNIGKGLAIVLLVLQISGSGGTFPIQVMPPFFQRLNPYLPFTYAISLMREAVGGILWDVVKKDLSIFIFITFITLLFGLVLKEPLEKWGGGLKRKASESRLIH
ncbi:YhgE/Pip domain-containing protein [Neobacillus ginsengisoli]|uniref:Membrane protein n=1 Tax=Neobacillus ginsengisoli TaxID=904295 RepID=A0ABT9XRQ1_9BACI|nr:YhgE/Pip domain-containing protein [Neobacillus ginsengisoli]MDQ0198031.1 putative membrane protein [Neobacillus ginsengisoli]